MERYLIVGVNERVGCIVFSGESENGSYLERLSQLEEAGYDVIHGREAIGEEDYDGKKQAFESVAERNNRGEIETVDLRKELEKI
jgi:hypothetical protein